MKHALLLLFVLFHTASTAQWQLTTPIKSNSEFEEMVMVTDQIGYATDWVNGAILGTEDGGATWERRQHLLFSDAHAIHMWDEVRGLAVGDGGRVYRTTDGFRTSSGSSDATYGSLNCVFFVNDTMGWVGTQSGKIYRSIDAGVSWTLMTSGQASNNYITAIQFVDTQVGYASCYGGGKVLKSIDGGFTWNSIAPEELVFIRDLHFSDALTGVAVGHAGHIISTTDGGASWTFMPSNTTYNLRSLSVQGARMVACGWWGHVVHSTDTGLTWTDQTIGPEHLSVAITPSGYGLMGSFGKIFRTQDFGATWAVIQNGTSTVTINKMSFANNSIGVVGNGLRTTDGGRTWTPAPSGGLGVHLRADGIGCSGGGSGSFARTTDYFATGIGAIGPDVAIRCTWSLNTTTHLVGGGHVYGGIYRTTDNGFNWTRVLDQGNIIINDLWFVNDTLGFAVGEDGNSHRTVDGGFTWENIGGGGGHTVFFFDHLHGWTKYYRTADGGDTWTMMGGTSQSTMSIFFTSLDTGYAVASSGQVERTVDGGVEWDNVLPPINNAMIYDAAYVDGYIVIAGSYGDIYRAQVSCPQFADIPVITEAGESLCTNTSGTAQWYLNDEPLPDGNTPCITANEPGNYHVIVTDGLGCVSAPSANVQVINTGIVPVIANGARLVPNPAVGVVRIERSDASPVVLTFLDAHGRVVRTEQRSGNSLVVDVTGLLPGMYLLRMASADGVETLRFVKE